MKAAPKPTPETAPYWEAPNRVEVSVAQGVGGMFMSAAMLVLGIMSAADV